MNWQLRVFAKLDPVAMGPGLRRDDSDDGACAFVEGFHPRLAPLNRAP
jgi:hypothetical protein